MNAETYIRKAEFNPKVCTYWLLSGAVAFVFTVVGIPLLLIWFPVGLLITKKYLSSMECVLTEKALKVKKGVLVKVEKTIPLEKITDMGMIQGPIMRAFDLHTLSIETAGQSGIGALVSLTGVVDAPAFREAVLSQRDAVSSSPAPTASSGEVSDNPSDTNQLLTEIRDTMRRIESLLEKNG
ncbi:MAG: PH domain-containing protein [Planctomycetota bacterium]